MINRLPGTTIEIAVSDTAEAKSVLDNIFMCGGLTLSQVASLTGLEPYVIQNWVKRGFLAPPVKKLYTQRKFCRIAIINMLRNVLMIEEITDLLSYINGRLNDESDDILGDNELYLYFIECVSACGSADQEGIEGCAKAAAADFCEPFPGARGRLEKVLASMLFAYYSARYKQLAEFTINTLD